jgi:cytochrome bd-type quinol oxidase subunit 2
VRSGAGAGTILTVVVVLAAAAAGIVLLVQRTTKAERSRSDVWWATAGFTLFVVTSAALVAWIYRATVAERAGTGTSSLSYIVAVAARASLAAFFVVRRRIRTYRRRRSGRSGASCWTWCSCSGTDASRSTSW